jgi:hypothetical protein
MINIFKNNQVSDHTNTLTYLGLWRRFSFSCCLRKRVAQIDIIGAFVFSLSLNQFRFCRGNFALISSSGVDIVCNNESMPIIGIQ